MLFIHFLNSYLMTRMPLSTLLPSVQSFYRIPYSLTQSNLDIFTDTWKLEVVLAITKQPEGLSLRQYVKVCDNLSFMFCKRAINGSNGWWITTPQWYLLDLRADFITPEARLLAHSSYPFLLFCSSLLRRTITIITHILLYLLSLLYESCPVSTHTKVFVVAFETRFGNDLCSVGLVQITLFLYCHWEQDI
jgi:hypothetical protein